MSVAAARTACPFAGVFEDGVLGGQALLRIVERGGFAVGVFEGLERADGIVLVEVGGGIVQRFDPVAREHGGVFLRAGFRGGDHRAARLLQRADGAAARAGSVDDQLAARGDAVAQRREFGAGNVRARQG